MKQIVKVVTNKMKNTVVVERVIAHTHPLYKKIILRTRRIKVHTTIPLEIGDLVEIESIRPISKEKHYKVTKKVTRI